MKSGCIVFNGVGWLVGWCYQSLHHSLNKKSAFSGSNLVFGARIPCFTVAGSLPIQPMIFWWTKTNVLCSKNKLLQGSCRIHLDAYRDVQGIWWKLPSFQSHYKPKSNILISKLTSNRAPRLDWNLSLLARAPPLPPSFRGQGKALMACIPSKIERLPLSKTSFFSELLDIIFRRCNIFVQV